SNFIGPELTDVLASVTAIGAMIVLTRFWKPRDKFDFGHLPPARVHYRASEVLLAWTPYISLVVMVLLWSIPLKAKLNSMNVLINWSGLHNLVQRVPPVVEKASPYAAVFNFQWLSAA